MDDEKLVAGAITGGITDTNSTQALKHAAMYYEEIRKNHADVKKIAENTEFTYDQVMLVKNYLFLDVHDLGDGVHRFDESFEISESWRRLAFDPKHIQPHDITLLNHELMEMRLVNEGLTQDEAHTIKSRKYDYSKESAAYYEEMKVLVEHGDGMVSGAISYLGRNTH